MDPANDEPDVLGKVDALMTRHRTATPAPHGAALPGQNADRASIPVLSEVVAEPVTIPVLTDALLPAKTDIGEEIPPAVEPMPTQADVGKPAVSPSLDEKTLHGIEDFLIRELEDRIALEFATTLDRALTELLDNSREHVRHIVREALETHLKNQAGDALLDEL